MLGKLAQAVTALLLIASPLSLCARSIVGIAIAKSNDHVYAWFDDGMFTEGTTSDFEKYSHALPYFGDGSTSPADIVAMSIAGDDHVYTWYRDQTVSEGTSGELAKYSKVRKSVTLPPNKKMANVVGIGIAGSDDKVYAWFDDQTVWIGNSRDLSLDGPHSYQLPADPYNPSAQLTVKDIVEMDIAKNDHVYTWFRNGMHSEGSSGNLARWATGPYIKAHVLYHCWCTPQQIENSAAIGSVTGAGNSGFGVASRAPSSPARAVKTGTPPHPSGSTQASQINGQGAAQIGKINLPPGPIKPYNGGSPPSGPTMIRTDGAEKDPMIAVSDKFMILSDATWIMFADRQGNVLPGSPGQMSTAEFFSAFTNKSPDNEIYLDHNVGFPGACKGNDANSRPPDITEGHSSQVLDGFCVMDFYDTRAYFDPVSRHFVVVSHAANNVQVDFTGSFPVSGACGYFKLPDGKHTKVHLTNPQDCLWSRFLYAIAVSKTDDPRDGFHQYVMTENGQADFPWLAVNGNRVVVSHHGPSHQPPHWPVPLPVVQILDLNALASGAHHPPFFHYFPQDLDGEVAVVPALHHGDTDGLTYLIAGAGQGVGPDITLTIFALPNDADPWQAPALMERTESMNYDPPAGLGAVYRNKMLYFASSVGSTPDRVRVTRIPIHREGESIVTSTSSSDGFLDQQLEIRNALEDGPDDVFGYNSPWLDVNAAGAMLIGYYRTPFQGKQIFPEARVTFWPAGAAEPHASRLVKAGDGPGKIGVVDYTTTVVDPVDDNTFWVALPYVGLVPDPSKPGAAMVPGQKTVVSYIP